MVWTSAGSIFRIIFYAAPTSYAEFTVSYPVLYSLNVLSRCYKRAPGARSVGGCTESNLIAIRRSEHLRHDNGCPVARDGARYCGYPGHRLSAIYLVWDTASTPVSTQSAPISLFSRSSRDFYSRFAVAVGIRNIDDKTWNDCFIAVESLLRNSSTSWLRKNIGIFFLHRFCSSEMEKLTLVRPSWFCFLRLSL